MTRLLLLHPLRSLCLLTWLALTGLAAPVALAGTAVVGLAVDTDNNAATGCSVATANGPAAGIELVATTVITTSTSGATAARLERQVCSGGVLGAPSTYDNGGWNVGLGNGSGGSAVVETSLPLSLLPPAATLRVVATAANSSGGQDATAPFTFTLLPAAGPAPVVAVPLSPWLLPPLALALFALTLWLRRRYPGQFGLVVLVVVGTASGLVWAATVLRDGNIADWSGVAPAISDANGDGAPNADIVAVYQQQDGVNLYVRVDADIRRDTAGNLAPVVSAGTAQTITLPAQATLAGTATDDGLPSPPGALTLTWSKVSGPGTVSFGNAALAATTASFSAAGVYVLQLAAFDGALTGTATVTITANASGGANQPPVVNAGANQTITLPAAATLTGIATDDGLPNPPGSLATTWSLVSGPLSGVTFGNPALPNTTATFAAPGTYVLQLTANDGALTASSTVQIVVVDGAPTLAVIADRTINLGTRFQQTLIASDGNLQDTLTYALTNAPTGASLNPAPLVDWIPSAAQLGTHLFTARVTDSSGQSATTTFNVTVVHVNQAPQLVPQVNLTIAVGTAFARTLTATDPDVGDTLTFALVSGPSGLSLSGSSLNWSTSGRSPGDYTVTVRATDSSGAFDQKSFTITLQQSASPLAVDDQYEVQLGGTLTVAPAGILANDLNPSGKPMSAVKKSDPARGSLSTFGADGAFTFVAPATNPPPPFGVSELWRNDASGQHVNTFPVIGDVNADGYPDLVLSSQFIGHRAVDGRTGGTLWNIDTTGWTDCRFDFPTTNAPVLADVDDDGKLEYVGSLAGCERDSRVNAAGYAPADRIFALDTTNGRVKWASPRVSASLGDVLAPGSPPSTEDRFQHALDATYYVNPSVTRLSASAPPTILFRRTIQSGEGYYTPISGPNRSAGCRGLTGLAADDGQACRATILMNGVDGTVQQILTAPNPTNRSQNLSDPWRDQAPFTLDIDGDGELEIVSGSDVWKKVGGTWTLLWQTHHEPIQTLATDLDGDGKPEIVHFYAFDKTGNPPSSTDINYQFNGLVIYDALTGAEVRRIRLPFYWTAWLTIADADGDGTPDFVINTQGRVMVVATDGRIRWTYDIPPGNIGFVLDARSGIANVQVYDLDGDGIPEVITNSHSGVVLLNGRDGTVKNRYPSSGFHGGYVAGHNVQVVDADNDGHADVLATNVSGPDRYSYILLRGAPNNWLPGPKAHHQVNFMQGDISGNGHVEFNTAVPTAFRNPKQLGTVGDPRATEGTSFTYAINDGETESAAATVFVAIKPTNRPPEITSTPPTGLYQRFNPPPTGGLFVNYYQVTAIDPDAGDTLTYTMPVAPAWHTMDATGRIRFEPTCGSYGQPCPWGWTYITVRVTDSQGAYAEQTFMVNLTTTLATVPNVVGQLLPAANAAIVAARLNLRVLNEVASLAPAGTVLAQDPLAGTSNIGEGTTVGLTVSSGPQPVAMPFLIGQQIAAANLLLSGAGLSANVTAVFSNTIPAGEVMAQSPAFGTLLQPATAPPADLTVSAGGPLPAPIASIALLPGPGPFARLAGETQQLKAIATLTDGTSADVSMSAAWSTTNAAAVTVDSTGLAKAKLAGTATIAASLSGKSGQVTLDVSALVPGDGTPPTALISSPTDDAALGGLTSIVGTTSDVNFLRFELAFAPAGTEDFTLITESTTAVTNGVLGTFDPTALLNDVYTLRLRVFDRGENQSEVLRTVQVTGRQKPGLFTLAYQDLTLPASGIPVTVVRNYDSRDKAKGDFGVGWRIGLQTLRLRTNRVPGTGWERIVSGPTVSLVPTSVHKVSLTLPGGKVEEFDLQLAPTSGIGGLSFTNVTGYAPRPGTLGKLEMLDNPNLFILAGVPEDELVDDSTLETFDPVHYRYTSESGIKVEIHRKLGVTRTTDRNGNTVTFGANGIIHSSGPSIVFTRDSKGRITQITDPMGNVQSYEYDGNGDLVRHVTATGDVVRFAYDSNHNLIDIRDPAGNQATRNQFDAGGHLISTTDARGNTITFSNNPAAQREVVTDRLGYPVIYDYDGMGNVVAKTDALGKVTTYTFDSRNNLLTETDPLGRVASKTYDSNNNVLTSVDFDGNLTTSTYNTFGQVLTQINPEGHLTTNVYNVVGDVTQTTDPEGGVTTYTYDGAGNRTSMTDALGRTTTYTYSAAGYQTSSTNPLGKTTTYTFDANGHALSETDAAGKTAFYTYDASGRKTSTTDKLGNKSFAAYTDVGLGIKISRLTDALGRVTTIDYDPVVNPIRRTFSDGSTESSAYDLENERVSSTDPDGRTTLFGHDALRRTTKTTLPGGATVLASYDAVGRVLTRTDERGFVTTSTYGPNRQTVTDPAGRTTQKQFDSQRRLVSVTDALGQVTGFTVDSFGNPLRTTYPDGSFKTITYDAGRQKLTETDQSGRIKQFAYDAAGRLIRVIDALGNITSYAYDAVGNLITVTDANGHVTTRGYDAMGRVVSRTLPSGKQEIFAFDAVGNIVSHTDFKGVTTSFAYDSKNRMTHKYLPGGNTIVYAHSAAGRRTQAGGDIYVHDAAGRLVQEQKASGETLIYTYDAAGNRTSLTTPHGATTYSYDALNRFSTVVDASGTTAYAYDLGGRLASLLRPNGVTTTYTYDSQDRLVQMTNTGPGGLLSSYAYTLGVTGNRLHVAEAGAATTGRTVAYAYDAIDRLTQEQITEPGPITTTANYTYDAVGNRIQLVRGGVTTAYTYDTSDRVLSEINSAGTVTSSYDDNGNLIGRSTATGIEAYIYDAENRMVASNGPAGNFNYSYDADGLRVGRTEGGVATAFLVDKNREIAQVVAETTGSNVATYTYGEELLSQHRSGMGSYFYLIDGQQSTRQLSSSSGNVSDSYTYDAFGVPLAANGTTPNAYRYTGEQIEPSQGLYYLRARYFEPARGRFITPDPYEGKILDPMSLHRFAYVNNSPVILRDPTGLLPFGYGYGISADCGAAGGIPWLGGFGALSGLSLFALENEKENVGFNYGAVNGTKSNAWKEYEVGGSLGCALGFNWTNAKKAGQLTGKSETWTYDFLIFSYTFSRSGKIWTRSLNVGFQLGLGYTHNTVGTTLAVP